MATARVAPVPPQAQAHESASSPIDAYHWLPCTATVEIPAPKFTVGDLLNLRKESVVRTATPIANDVPVRVNGLLLGRGRFEVVNDRLGLRITEVA